MSAAEHDEAVRKAETVRMHLLDDARNLAFTERKVPRVHSDP